MVLACKQARMRFLRPCCCLLYHGVGIMLRSACKRRLSTAQHDRCHVHAEERHKHARRRYDPYGRVLTEEEYDQQGMRAVRRAAVERARGCKAWGLVLGTLGRQGNPAILRRLEALFDAAGLEYFVVLMSEVTPPNLALMTTVDAWVQIACPRCAFRICCRVCMYDFRVPCVCRVHATSGWSMNCSRPCCDLKPPS